jgi:hypothetical protein
LKCTVEHYVAFAFPPKDKYDDASSNPEGDDDQDSASCHGVNLLFLGTGRQNILAE